MCSYQKETSLSAPTHWKLWIKENSASQTEPALLQFFLTRISSRTETFQIRRGLFPHTHTHTQIYHAAAQTMRPWTRPSECQFSFNRFFTFFPPLNAKNSQQRRNVPSVRRRRRRPSAATVLFFFCCCFCTDKKNRHAWNCESIFLYECVCSFVFVFV